VIHLLFAYKLCGRFQSEGRMPHDSDDMLWSESAANGIFSATSEPEKRRLAAEDKRFYLAVITDRPLAVVRVTLLSTVQAATAFSLSDFNYDVAMRATYRQKLPEPILAEVKNACIQSRQPPRHLGMVHAGRFSGFGDCDPGVIAAEPKADDAGPNAGGSLHAAHSGRSHCQRCNMRRIVQAERALSDAANLAVADRCAGGRFGATRERSAFQKDLIARLLRPKRRSS
jgi:hypothetical protein